MQKFDSNGNFLAMWKISNVSEGYGWPPVVAADGAGNVYVYDNYNQLQKFDGNGNFLAKWGTKGMEIGFFNKPSGAALDISGNVYVVDSDNHRIQAFDSNGNFLTTWGSFGSGDGQFSYPAGLAVDSSGNIYVADTGNNRIQKFDSSGNFLAQWGSTGSGKGEFSWPNAIAVDSAGNMYVADTGNGRIQKFDSSGNFLARWGTWVPITHCEMGCFFDWGCGEVCTDMWWPLPIAVTIDTTGNAYVLHDSPYEEVNSQVIKYDSSGRFLGRWGSPGSGIGQLSYPSGLAIDSFNNIYVTDTGNNRIQKFGSKGKFLSDWGSRGIGDGQFKGPRGIGVDNSGNVYVADTRNHRIQKFEQTFDIKGEVKKANGAAMAGVLMTLSGDASKTVTTDSNGRYKFKNIANGNYTITPGKTGFTFTPASITLDISGTSVKGQNFTGVKN
jgi:sugar lactone lactonase YvrE